MEGFFVENSVVPAEDFDKPFVLRHSIKITKGKPNPNKFEEDQVWFAVLFTTQRLLRNGVNSKVIQADSTYKILYEGYPIQLFGTSDINNAFHLIAFGFSSNENQDTYELGFSAIRDGMFELLHEEAKFAVLVSDAAMAIKNAFNSVFPDRKTITCWFHVKKNIREKLANNDNREAIIEDINKLQLCDHGHLFNKASRLFVNKWLDVENDFIMYFGRQWLSHHNQLWFEGAESFVPKTNNGLESTNGRLKSDFFHREKFTLPAFKSKIITVVQTFSCEYRDGLKKIETETSFAKELWKDGSEWARSSKKTSVDNSNDDGTSYFIPAGEDAAVKAADLKSYKDMKWKRYDDFVDNRFKIWRVFVPKGLHALKRATCSCPVYLKKYKCKHIVGLGLRLHLIDVPADSRPIGKKRAVGRIKKAGPALSKD